MATQAELIIDGKTMKVLECEYGFSQEIDGNSRPNSIVRGGMINLVVESSKDELIHTWMTDSRMKKDGSIKFKRNEAESAMRTLDFKNGLCIQFRESFNAYGDQPMVMSFTITAEELRANQMKHKNQW